MLIHSQKLNPDEPEYNDIRCSIAPGEQLPKFSGYMTSTHDAALKPHMLCQSFCKSRFARTNMRWELFIYFWVKCPVQYIMYFSANHRTKQPSVIGREQCAKWENTRSWYILQKSKTCSVLDRLLEQSDSKQYCRILKSHARCTKFMWGTVRRYRSRTLNNVVSTQNHVQLWVRRTFMYHFQVLSNIVINRYLIFKPRIAAYAEQCS